MQFHTSNMKYLAIKCYYTSKLYPNFTRFNKKNNIGQTTSLYGLLLLSAQKLLGEQDQSSDD